MTRPGARPRLDRWSWLRPLSRGKRPGADRRARVPRPGVPASRRAGRPTRERADDGNTGSDWELTARVRGDQAFKFREPVENNSDFVLFLSTGSDHHKILPVRRDVVIGPVAKQGISVDTLK